MKLLTCGCCDQGCVCVNHQDVPRGLPARVCEHHAVEVRLNGEYLNTFAGVTRERAVGLAVDFLLAAGRDLQGLNLTTAVVARDF